MLIRGKMDKRGAETLLWNIILILLFLTAFGLVAFWEYNNLKGEAIRPDMIAKHTALLIDVADSGTTIFVNAEIKIEGRKVVAIYRGMKSEYSFFSKNNVTARKVDGGSEIKVE